jgi:hypothetical protein
MKLTDRQIQFLDNLLSIPEWQEPGYDRIKITHRKDGRYQISWQYRRKDNSPLHTVADESSFIYLSYADMRYIMFKIKQALAEVGI